MRRRSCVGFLSPSSSPLMSCWSLRCSETALRLMSSTFNLFVVWVVSWRAEEVANFSGEVGREIADDVVELHLLCCDTSCGELCFDLGKPDFLRGQRARRVAV